MPQHTTHSKYNREVNSSKLLLGAEKRQDIDFTGSSPATMTGWRRVSHTNPCPICGKPDWCLISSDGTKAVCQRVESNRPWGNAGYLHNLNGSEDVGVASYATPTDSAFLNDAQHVARATPEGLHAAYSSLLDYLPLTDGHAQALKARGLSEDAIRHAGYGSLVSSRSGAVAKLRAEGIKLAGVPGFYLGATGNVELNGPNGLMIPVRDDAGLIVGIQIRRDSYEAGQGSKYVWLSSYGQQYGCGSGTPVHLSLSADTEFTEPVIVTEGVLKADIISYLLKVATIGVPGVSSWFGAVKVLARLLPCRVCIAFDEDQFTNEAVERCVSAIKDRLCQESFKVYEARWARGFKGFDDYLANGNNGWEMRRFIPAKHTPTPYKETDANSYKKEFEREWAFLDILRDDAPHPVAPLKLVPFTWHDCECPYCNAAHVYLDEREAGHAS